MRLAEYFSRYIHNGMIVSTTLIIISTISIIVSMKTFFVKHGIGKVQQNNWLYVTENGKESISLRIYHQDNFYPRFIRDFRENIRVERFKYI